MNAIVTGSQLYGTPTDKSDIDLVILVSQDDLMLLVGFASNAEPQLARECDAHEYKGIGGLSASLRFGKLNLIVTTDPLAFEVWRRGTQAMVLHKELVGPITRDQAKEYLASLREHCGVITEMPTIQDTILENPKDLW